MDQQPCPEPTASASALAERRGLGDWSGYTALPRKRMFSRKWEDARLYLYQGGVVVTGPQGHEAAYDWRSTRVLMNRVTVNGGLMEARYTLVDPAGEALAVGPGGPGLLKSQMTRLGINSMVSGAEFLYPGDWGNAIQEAITRAQLPEALARIQRGGAVEFGDITADGQGLSDRKRTAPWPSISEIGLSNGTFSCSDSRGRALLSMHHVPQIPNVYLLLNLSQRLRG
ncbi:DUF6585 family protein [Streptomyces oceani]|uniref:Uncharacterized protein n=1 Tax=Streptomyces oceani TaxID=1075402 RepID=A0A1E7JXF6_9ACTN|nr:DUF6585 family protein [Streptomyces oceani]OEU96347.1 hypothetical protein AN216_21035 [Streptomyces oceani]